MPSLDKHANLVNTCRFHQRHLINPNINYSILFLIFKIVNQLGDDFDQ